MTWDPFSLVIWAFFSCKSVHPTKLFTTSAEDCASSDSFGTLSTLSVDLLSCLCVSQNLRAQVLQILLLFRNWRIQNDTQMVRDLSQFFFEKTSIYPDSCLSDQRSSHTKHCHESLEITAHLPSLILSSSKLHIFLSLCNGWAYQESDMGSVLWQGSGSECGRCILSMITLNHFHVVLHALSTTLFSWRNLNAHYLENLVSMDQERWTKFSCELADVLARSLPLLSMWHLLLQVSLCSLVSHCFDLLSVLRSWLPQSDDNFELRLCTCLPKPKSQGRSCLALPEHPPLLNIFSFFDWPNSASGTVLRSNCPPITLVGLSASPQGMQSTARLFLAGPVGRYCPIFNISA